MCSLGNSQNCWSHFIFILAILIFNSLLVSCIYVQFKSSQKQDVSKNIEKCDKSFWFSRSFPIVHIVNSSNPSVCLFPLSLELLTKKEAERLIDFIDQNRPSDSLHSHGEPSDELLNRSTPYQTMFLRSFKSKEGVGERHQQGNGALPLKINWLKYI